MGEPVQAKRARILQGDATRVIEINDEVLPWFIYGDVTITPHKSATTLLTFTVMVDGPVSIEPMPLRQAQAVVNARRMGRSA